MALVLELQQDCLNADRRVSDILRKAKALAAKLSLSELVGWINQELNGYDCAPRDLPRYRKPRGSPKFLNPMLGYCPIIVRPGVLGEVITTVILSQGISELEELASAPKGSDLIYTYPPAVEEVLHQQMDLPMECSLHFSPSQVLASIDSVRNKVLDWTLELEARRILGDGRTFNAEEKRKAASVTNHIYGGNIGVLGNVSGGATNSDFASINGNIPRAQISVFARQVAETLPSLPEEKRSEITAILSELNDEGAKDAPDRSKVANSLGSLRSILEGMSGNLAASGILTAISTLMSG